MATRSRKEEIKYKKFRNSDKFTGLCTFCNIVKGNEQFVEQTKSFKIIKNLFGYTQWDGQGVVDHLLLVPKKHTDAVNSFTSSESVEFMGIVGSYEQQGYDYFARAPKSNRKTVRHQHTHLIKLDRKAKKFILYMNKPHIRLLR